MKELRKKEVLTLIRNRIVTGLIIVIPTGLTIFITLFIYNHLTQWAVNIIIDIAGEHANMFWLTQSVRMFSLFLIVLILFLIGELARYTIGKKAINITEKLLLRVPMLKSIYITTRQIGDAIWSPKGRMFRKVVLFEYPRKGIYVIGFLTNDNNEGELNEKSGEKLISIFLPTTPNPTSGFLLFVPEKDCIFLDMDITEAMRLIISGGAISPANGKTISLHKIAEERD